MKTLADFARATGVVVRALAAGRIEPRRARLLQEILESAHDRLERNLGDDAVDPGGRNLSSAEIDFMIANGGRLPPGVTTVFVGAFRVEGEWVAPKSADEPEAGEAG